MRIDLDVSTYTRLYLYNAVSNKWQYLNGYTDGIITADTAGRYLLTNQNLKFANINWTFFIAGGVVVWQQRAGETCRADAAYRRPGRGDSTGSRRAAGRYSTAAGSRGDREMCIRDRLYTGLR